MRETLTWCLEWLEQWGALTRHEDTCTFTFVAGDFFEVSLKAVTHPSVTLLELIYAVYEDHEATRTEIIFRSSHNERAAILQQEVTA